MSASGLSPERVKALLDARSAALAARGDALAAEGERRAYLVCACGSERYALPLARIAAVMPTVPATTVPGSPAALRGIVALSGTIVSVLDLARMLGVEAGEAPGHLVRLRGQEPPVALAVDRAVGVADIDAGLDGSSPGRPHDPQHGGPLGEGAVSGYCPPDPDAAEGAREGFSILDLPRLLRPYLP